MAQTEFIRPRRRALAMAAAGLALVHGAAIVQAQPPLRYNFQPGDRLVYQRSAIVASLETGAVEQQITDQIQIWCLERTDEDTLVLLDTRHFVNAKGEPVRGALFRIDSRGNRDMEAGMLTRISEMDAGFDLLPVLRAAMAPGPSWTTPGDVYGRRWHCERQSPDAERGGHIRVTFTVEDTTGVSEAIGEERFGTFWFDPRAGCVTRVESELRHRTAGVTVQAKIKLVERRSNSGGWAAQRVGEARTFLRTLGNEDRLLRDVLARPAEIDATVRHLNRLWSGLAAKPGPRANSPVRDIAAAQHYRVGASENSLRLAAARCRRWLGKRSIDWSLQDPDGETVRSAELRDQVMIECYWSADSLWGLRSLEMMRRLTAELAGKPVRIVLLNMDRDVELARWAIKSCGNDLKHVLAESLSTREPELDFPTVRVIDRKGVVRQVVIGWRPDIHAELKAMLERLFAN